MKTYETESKHMKRIWKQRQESIAIKIHWLFITNIYVSPQTKIRTDLATKIPNSEAHLITGDINIEQPLIGVNDQQNNRTGRIIDEENYIILNNCGATNIAGGTLDVLLF